MVSSYVFLLTLDTETYYKYWCKLLKVRLKLGGAASTSGFHEKLVKFEMQSLHNIGSNSYIFGQFEIILGL